MKHPFGINPSDEDVVRVAREALASYSSLPETTCSHRACCCKAGCPNMYYSEYLSIRCNFIDDMGQDERLGLLLGCIRYYLFDQYEKDENGQKVPFPKPCLHLSDDNKCKVYGARPLKCRTYGLVPPSMHRRIVAQVASENKMDPADVPLCIQCPFVKVKDEYKTDFPDGYVGEDLIAEAEMALSQADRSLGISRKIQDEGFGFLTFHDWHIMSELGEGWMADLTPLRQKLTKDEKEKFVEDLKTAFKKSAEGQDEI